ncbi:MAG: 4'-phosphopantetheinyl transferase superfamily protein [Lachnospiraceae bacterium]|nr:4'-phosphopantetheinyl transferase superfamily protein [Lachnospiraceae bacterium]
MKLYIMDVTIPPLEFFLPRVSEDRIGRMKKFKFEMDRRRGLAAEALLNYGIKQLCPGLSFPLELKRDENGRPSVTFSGKDKRLLLEAGVFLEEEDGIEFSLSHSGDYAVCAISDRQGEKLGVDIEKRRKNEGKIAEHFFCENEVKRIRTAEDFYRYWTLKESFTKAVGLGLGLSLNSFEVQLSGEEAEFIYPDDPETFRGRIYEPFDGYTVAVCVRGKQSFPEEIESVDNKI